MPRLILWLGWLVASLLAGEAAEPKTPKQPTPKAGWLVSFEHIPQQPRSGETVRISAVVHSEITNLVLLYQVVEPGAYIEMRDPAFVNNWVSLPMQPSGRTAEGLSFEAQVPGDVQKNRRLIRYRLRARDSDGKSRLAPGLDSVPPNEAYFVYDGIPGWAGAIDPRSGDPNLASTTTFPPAAIKRIQAYQLLGKRRSIENATWREHSSGKDYKYTGTLVVDGEVFDHIGYRARGGVWRYALGKNMWKFSLPGGHDLQAKDDFGQPYAVRWTKINLRACIQQGDYGQRGEQGMFESVGFRLFNLAGVTAPSTHWVQLRIVDEPVENPPDQYRGDFWGLYLAIENEDGRFLKAHHRPSGNLFKMQFGTGELQHHASGAVTNLSDLFGFMNSYRQGRQPDSWWQNNFDLTNYYSYRAICECIHHYDVDEGKNYDFYHNPQTGKWEIMPWDIDLTWADHMYGSGEDPFKRLILSRPAFRLEYQNRLREIRDLLFNPEQTGQIIDEFATVIWDDSGAPSIAEADRRKWDYHPMMAMGMKAGQGLFYQAGRTGDFPGMVKVMKDYVRSRSAWIDSALLRDSAIPETPTVTYGGPANFPSDQLRFSVSSYKGANAFAAIKWRLAEVTPPAAHVPGAKAARSLPEITPLWESAELSAATAPGIVPEHLAIPGHTYRVRAKMKDVTSRWSHWSAPVEFASH